MHNPWTTPKEKSTVTQNLLGIKKTAIRNYFQQMLIQLEITCHHTDLIEKNIESQENAIRHPLSAGNKPFWAFEIVSYFASSCSVVLPRGIHAPINIKLLERVSCTCMCSVVKCCVDMDIQFDKRNKIMSGHVE